MQEERARLESTEENWRFWGPYLSERQWGTVREDYSEFGTAWDFFTHDQARSRTYRWGEDGIAGISDERQLLCFSPTFWNGKDPILKERLFGLSGTEGNHSEDVKELYYYLENTPSHAYMKYVYFYPNTQYPYESLVHENRTRNKLQPEFELQDHACVLDKQYFEIHIEYAKYTPYHILIQIEITNHSDSTEDIWILPTLWFRNTWRYIPNEPLPSLHENDNKIRAFHRELKTRYTLEALQSCEEIIFTDNETHAERLFGLPSYSPYVKDAFHTYIIGRKKSCVNPQKTGTKAAIVQKTSVASKQSAIFKFELYNSSEKCPDFDKVLAQRKAESREFYNSFSFPQEYITLCKQAYAGMLWSKQWYYFDLGTWLQGDVGQHPPPAQRLRGRNSDWTHLKATDILSMPDKWEYPWFAAWDSAFHSIAFARIDPEFAKNQLLVFLESRYMNAQGQIPAYEWAFGDVNPPVHSIGVWEVYLIDKEKNSAGDLAFLKKALPVLDKNFDWWMQHEKLHSNYLFKGGFMGLDNISVIDRGAPLPEGMVLAQVDTTCWMAKYALLLMRMHMEIQSAYEIIKKYFDWFNSIVTDLELLYDPDSNFYFDVIFDPSESKKNHILQVKNVTGLFPLYLQEYFPEDKVQHYPTLVRYMQEKLLNRFSTRNQIIQVSGLDENRKKLLRNYVFDTNEFLGKFGIRSLSYFHNHSTYDIPLNVKKFPLRYMPNESETTNFGENSNWRGPVWLPINYLLIQSLLRDELFHRNTHSELPSALQIAKNILAIFQKDPTGKVPVYARHPVLQDRPEFNNKILFYEYFNPENGAGIGASHQTGWTGLVTELAYWMSRKNNVIF